MALLLPQAAEPVHLLQYEVLMPILVGETMIIDMHVALHVALTLCFVTSVVAVFWLATALILTE